MAIPVIRLKIIAIKILNVICWNARRSMTRTLSNAVVVPLAVINALLKKMRRRKTNNA
jgi:hypothetical protein